MKNKIQEETDRLLGNCEHVLIDREEVISLELDENYSDQMEVHGCGSISVLTSEELLRTALNALVSKDGQAVRLMPFILMSIVDACEEMESEEYTQCVSNGSYEYDVLIYKAMIKACKDRIKGMNYLKKNTKRLVNN